MLGNRQIWSNFSGRVIKLETETRYNKTLLMKLLADNANHQLLMLNNNDFELKLNGPKHQSTL